MVICPKGSLGSTANSPSTSATPSPTFSSAFRLACTARSISDRPGDSPMP